MKSVLAICLLALLASSAQAAICEVYSTKISREDILFTFSKMYTCIFKKAEDLEKMKDNPIDIDAIQKQFYDIKFDCFNQVKNPSDELKDLFQCYKNYYEAKFDTSIKVPTLEDQRKGTDSDSWGDDELKKQVEEDYKERTSTSNVVLYIFCVVLGIAILALIVAIIFSKYRMYVNRDAGSLGTSSLEFGSSAQYQKQTDN